VNRIAALTLAASLAGALCAQNTNPVIKEARGAYDSVKNNILRAADKMPEEAYSFKPTPEQQTFAERMAHIAGQIRTCSSVKGEQKQSDAGSKTAKADLVAALKASFDECDAAWDSLTDANALEMIQAGRGQRSRLGILIGNTNHDSEMYGYISVYLRLKGVVPPSSEPRGGRK